ncbi:MAG: protein kinase [Deltaproteobacteria bacterium]|nr:protein kinase [Deltaproteobacteria bacterium]
MEASKEDKEARRIADRYQVKDTVGTGGMGSVYRVRDESTGRTVALKQLSKTAFEKKPEYVALFQHEYYTLAQLAHPLIIEVYDYGVDEQGPYFTMEYLPGEDLQQMAPVDWRRGCAVLRDIATSLAILHSRRVVHRDVSLHNVRCNEKGRAKLIDFGAMVPMGIVKKVVGTPPFIAPEVMTQQPIDGRADLYSLGAVAYYLLTGRYAFYSKTINGLIDAWRSRPIVPSKIITDIPAALDNLVISLLSLDKLARPINAAEVIDRLNAIADLPEKEPLELSQAYISTPPLVGRERFTTLFRKMMPGVMASRGGTVMVESVAGVGRTRLLNALVLEGKLAGALVITASSVDARMGDYGVIRALIEDLLTATPSETLAEAEKNAAILSLVSPELHEKLGSPRLPSYNNPIEFRARVQTALQSLFTSYSANRRLMIAVDDVHKCDEPSAAVLAAISRMTHRLKLALAVTAEIEIDRPYSEPVRMIRESGTVIELQPLTQEDNQNLIQSMFGEVANISIVADWVYEISRGNVRTVMELVEHLVDSGIARYQDGNWILPKNLREQNLPKNLEHALEARILKLSEPARALAESLSLVTEQIPLRLEHYVILSEDLDEKKTYLALDELVASQILVTAGDHYNFCQPGFADVLRHSINDDKKKSIHIRLALAYKSGNYRRPLALIYHMLQAGEEEKALELLIPLITSTDIYKEPYSIQVQCCEAALKLASKQNSRKIEMCILYMCLIRLAKRYDILLLKYAKPLEEQLLKDSGLAFWDEVGNQLDPSERIKLCINRAFENWSSTPEQERGLDPVEAIRQLILYAVSVTSAIASSFNAKILSHVHFLVVPFATISAAADFIERIIRLTLDQVLGYSVTQQRLEMQTIFSQPIAELDEEYRCDFVNHTNPYTLALVEASNANPLALERADLLEQDPRFATHAWEVRLVANLYAGRSQQAFACLRQKELLAIQNPESDSHLLAGFIFEAWAYGMSGDLMGLKQVLIPISEKAEKYPGWVPFLLAVRGNYHLLRGELAQARRDLEKMMEIAPIGQHFAWHRGIPVLVETLIEMREFERAYKVASQSLETAEAICPYPEAVRELHRVLALADAKLGNFAEATKRIEATIDKARNEEVGGEPLGVLYEAAAWIALAAQDDERFGAYTELTAKQYKPGLNPSLNAKVEKLKEEMKRRQLPVSDGYGYSQGWTADKEFGPTVTASIMTSIPPLVNSVLKNYETQEDRAEQALKLLIEHTQADESYLYALKTEGLVLVAPLNRIPPPGLSSRMSEYLNELEMNDGEKTVTMTSDFDQAVEDQRKVIISDDGYTFQPVVLVGSYADGYKIAGLAALKIRQGTPFNPAWNAISTIGKLIA